MKDILLRIGAVALATFGYVAVGVALASVS